MPAIGWVGAPVVDAVIAAIVGDANDERRVHTAPDLPVRRHAT
jgi:hypothetical protein